MRTLQVVGAALALVASVFVLRIVHHLYSHHGHLDLFHLLVGIGSASFGLYLVYRFASTRLRAGG